MRIAAATLLFLGHALLLGASVFHAAPAHAVVANCPPPPKSDDPQCFVVTTKSCPKTGLCVDQPVIADLDCHTTVIPGNSHQRRLHCDAFPVELFTDGMLGYEWRITAGGVSTYPPSPNGGSSMVSTCQIGDTVSVRLTVTNGTYSANRVRFIACGGIQN